MKNHLSYFIRPITIYIKEHMLEIISLLITLIIFTKNFVEKAVEKGYQEYFGLVDINITLNIGSFWEVFFVILAIFMFIIIGNWLFETCYRNILNRNDSQIERHLNIFLLFLLFWNVIYCCFIIIMCLVFYYSNRTILIESTLSWIIIIGSLIANIYMMGIKVKCKGTKKYKKMYIICLCLISITSLCVLYFFAEFFTSFFFLIAFLLCFAIIMQNTINTNESSSKNLMKTIGKIRPVYIKFTMILFIIMIFIFGILWFFKDFGRVMAGTSRYYSIIYLKEESNSYDDKQTKCMGNTYLLFDKINGDKIIMKIKPTEEGYYLVEKGEFQYLKEYDKLTINIEHCIIDNGEE